jgi:hypothetical protein
VSDDHCDLRQESLKYDVWCLHHKNAVSAVHVYHGTRGPTLSHVMLHRVVCIIHSVLDLMDAVRRLVRSLLIKFVQGIDHSQVSKRNPHYS